MHAQFGPAPFDRPREDRPKFDRPREDRPNSIVRVSVPKAAPTGRYMRAARIAAGFADRPRRDNEDESRVFAKHPAFGGRGAYRERTPDGDKRASWPPTPKKNPASASPR